jgi:photosystem II stability/assembly factor-like uncharacterized protein
VSRTKDFGIDRPDWFIVGGCESGYIAPHPTDADISYAGCYDGVIERFDRRTDQLRSIDVYPDNPMGWGAEGMKYRFQWTFPIVFSPHDPNTLYAGGNRVFRTTNEGQSWEAISPDITRNDPAKLGPSGGPITKDNTAVEYYATVFALAESRLEKGLIWAGSDDGVVSVTRDGGRTWADVTPPDMRPGKPFEWSMVSQIDPSPHAAGTMYLAVNRYKLDDYRPMVYITDDYGKTWRMAASGIPADAFVRVVREDPARKGLLFAGTERGTYVSFDNGARWQPLQLNLPVVPITDLIVKDNDIVVSTQGRAFWVLDDIGPLRQTAASGPTDTFLFKPSPAYRFGGPSIDRPGLGKNPPYGAVVYYNLKAEPKENEEVTLEFLDASGAVVRKFSNKPEKDADGAQPEEDFFPAARSPKTIPAKAGLNRFAWDLRHPDATKFKGMILWSAEMRGPSVVPGTYQVRLTAGGRSLSESFEVRKDPRLPATVEDFRNQYDMLKGIHAKVSEAHEAIVRIREAKDQIKAIAERSKSAGKGTAIADAAKALGDKLTAVEEALYQTKNQSNQDPLNFPIRLTNKLASLAGQVGQSDSRPTDQSQAVYDDLVGRVDAELAKLKAAFTTDLPAFNKLVREQEIPAVVVK